MRLSKCDASDSKCKEVFIAALDPSPRLAMQCHRYNLADFEGPLPDASMRNATLSYLLGSLGIRSMPGVAPTNVPFGQRVMHGGDLICREETTVCIDVAQYGVGGIDSWCSEPLPQYMINKAASFDWAFLVMPLQSADKLI